MATNRALSTEHRAKNQYYITMEGRLARALFRGLHLGAERMAKEGDELLKSFRAYCDMFPGRNNLPQQYQAFLDYANPQAVDGLLQLARHLPEPEQKAAIQEIISKAQGYTFKESYRARLILLQKETAARVMQDAQPILNEVVQEARNRATFAIVKETRAAWKMNTPPKREIEAIIKNSNVSRWVSKSTKTVTDSMYHLAVEGIATGRASSDIADELHEMRKELKLESARVTDTEKWRSRFMARTMVTETAAQAEADALKGAGLKKYMFVCNLDEATCEICGQLDGKIFLLEDMSEDTRPPVHPNCRCRIAPVIPEKYREKMKRGAQVGEANGGASAYTQVPATMTYSQWREQYGPGISTYNIKTKKFEI